MQPAYRWRRLAALCYDCLVVLALCFVVSALALIVTRGQAIAPGNLVFQTLLVSLISGYFCLSWHYGGQTVGMRAWRLVIANDAKHYPTGRQCLLRLFWGMMSIMTLGLVFITSAMDRFSGTHMRLTQRSPHQRAT